MLYFGIPRHTQWDQIWLWLSISSNNGSKLHYGNVDGVYYYINTTLNSHVQHTLLNSWVSLVRLLRVSTNFFSSSSTRLLSSCFSSAHTALCWARTWNKIIKEQYNRHADHFADKKPVHEFCEPSGHRIGYRDKEVLSSSFVKIIIQHQLPTG